MNPKIWIALDKLNLINKHPEVFKAFLGYEDGKAKIALYLEEPTSPENASFNAINYDISLEALCDLIYFFTGELVTPGLNATDLFEYRTHRKIIMCQLILEDCLLYINFEDDRVEENTSIIAEENMRKLFKVIRKNGTNIEN